MISGTANSTYRLLEFHSNSKFPPKSISHSSGIGVRLGAGRKREEDCTAKPPATTLARRAH